MAKTQTRLPEVSMPFLLEVLGLEPLVECAHRPRAIVGGIVGSWQQLLSLAMSWGLSERLANVGSMAATSFTCSELWD